MSTERPIPQPNQGVDEHSLTCCATSKPAKTPELVVPEAVRPPPADRSPEDPDLAGQTTEADDRFREEQVSTPDAYDPWQLPGGVVLLGPPISFEEHVAGWDRARDLHYEHLRKRRVARRWWKAKLGKQEFTRQRRNGELLAADFDRWLANQPAPGDLIGQHQIDVLVRRERRSRPRRVGSELPADRGGSAGDA